MLTFKKSIPESVGIPSESILNMINRLEYQKVPMHSLLILKDDSLVFESYYAPFKADTPHRMFSITKSLCALGIGILEAEGKLSLDDPVIKYFPEYSDKAYRQPGSDEIHPFIATMTIKNLVMMRSSHASTTYKINMKSDWVESFFTTAPTHKPGTVFHYDTSAAHVLGALIEKLSGMSLIDFMKSRLSELDIFPNAYVLADPFGVPMGGSGLVATSMDILKLGYLLLKDGCINNKQLVPAEYIKTATSNLSPNCVGAPLPSEASGYGYMIWRTEKDGYVLYGMGGQLVIVFPKLNMICVTTADTQGMAGGNQLIYNALYEEVLPYIENNELQAIPVLQNKLSQKASSLSVQPLSAIPLESNQLEAIKKLTSSISGKPFKVIENTTNGAFSAVQFDFYDSDASQLKLSLGGDDICLSFEFDSLVSGNFPGYKMNYLASAAWLDERTLYIRFNIVDEYLGSVHFEFYFGDNDVSIFMRKIEESLFAEYNGHLYCGIV